MRWEAKELPTKSIIEKLQKEVQVSQVIATLLAQRSIEDFASAKQFFRPQREDLHDPFLMKDMDNAVNRISKAVENHEKIMVYGDYDVDGTTSVALMTSFLKEHTEEVNPYIPDRYQEGYGVSYAGIDAAYEQNITLIIALDCGIKAHEKVTYALDKGIDFIICDHHLPGASLPNAKAVLDPKRKDCTYPYDELCGCGVGFKLLQALSIRWSLEEATLYPYLDLVATAIAADIVPIDGENRTLCFFGINQLRTAPRHGIGVFLKELKSEVTITDLVFKVAPRINAAGRMEHALTAAHMLMSNEKEDINRLSEAIEAFNTERRTTDQIITQEAINQIVNNNEEDCFSTVVYNEDWHKGVVGIVASRLIETYYRPTVVLTRSGDDYVGSVRSVKGFNVYDALSACKSFMTQFGGHKYAAGLTLHKDQLIAFKKAFEEKVSQSILPNQKEPVLQYDYNLTIDNVDTKLFRIIEQMGPFGPNNMRPVFLSENCIDSGHTKVVGKDNTHLRLSVQTEKGPLVGIGFGLAEFFPAIKKGNAFDLLYTLDKNQWNGKTTLQLKIKDLRIRP
jgi:single-stranded-DNA-specific exonuclease